jgi:hypothetical protein
MYVCVNMENRYYDDNRENSVLGKKTIQLLLKGKLSLYRPLGIQQVEAPNISTQSAHEGGKVVSATYQPPLPPGEIPGTHLC